MRRIEALGDRSKALSVMSGDVLSDELDPELQQLTEDTSRELGTPIAAVTLLLDNIQLFRAAHGLGGELGAARATDRDLSFCQFVVRDAAVLEVNDATVDARVPQELVVRFGIRSYIGAPISLGGEVVGAMCAVDIKPRQFTAQERDVMVRMADAASKRLAVLAMRPRDRERALRDRAVRPVFGELRNLLQPFLGNVACLDGAIAEIAAAQRLAHHVAKTGEVAQLSLLTRTDAALAELRQGIGELVAEAEQIHRGIIALERATLVSNSGCQLAEVVEAATTLALHRTKLVAGLRWTGERRCSLRAPRAVAVTTLAAAIASVSEALYTLGLDGGVDVTIMMEGPVAVLRLVSALPLHEVSTILDELTLLLGDTRDMAVSVHERVLEIEFAVSWPHARRVHDLDSPAA